MIDPLAPTDEAQPFRGDDAQCHRGDDAERAKRDLGRLEDVGSLVFGTFITSPAAVTNVSPTTCVAMEPKRTPVPWVPVLMAPAMLCTSMSPRFSCASPRLSNSSPSSLSRVPAWTAPSPVGVHRLDALHVIQRDQHIVRLRQRRERMAVADDAHVAPLAAIAANRLRQFVEAARREDGARRAPHRVQTSYASVLVCRCVR